jgi:hypothetical protein
VRAAAALFLVLVQPTSTLASDDDQMLRQLGYVAGQAVACDIEEPDVAAQVATSMADAMALTDEASHEVMVDQALRAAAGPCAAPAGRLDEIKANWRAMRRRAGLD